MIDFLPIDRIQGGEVLAKDVYKDNVLLVKKGYVLTKQKANKLKAHGVIGVFVKGEGEGVRIPSATRT